MPEKIFYTAQIVMAGIGLLCFIALYFIPAGYGKMRNKKWGFSFNNKAAWILMELPSCIMLPILWANSPYKDSLVRIIIASFFVFHYVQRTLVFPLLLKGKGKMPLSIVLMGIIFNTINSLLIGGWLFYVSPPHFYPTAWLSSPQFIIGAFLFVYGMGINIHSDAYIRSLRAAGDSKHYFPHKGFYKYVTSANYFGELVEWTGFAILSWNTAAALFVFWTAANLVPRAHSIHAQYRTAFPKEMAQYKPKRIFPFIY